MNVMSENEDSEYDDQQGHRNLPFDLDDNADLKWCPSNQHQQVNKAKAAASRLIVEANKSVQNTIDFHYWRATIEVAADEKENGMSATAELLKVHYQFAYLPFSNLRTMAGQDRKFTQKIGGLSNSQLYCLPVWKGYPKVMAIEGTTK